MAFCSVTAENSAGLQETILKDAVKFVLKDAAKFIFNQEYFLLNC